MKDNFDIQKYFNKVKLMESSNASEPAFEFLSLLNSPGIKKQLSNLGDSLEEEEYNRLKTALGTIEGLGKNDIEMVHRITDAETVEVAPKA